MADEDRSFSPQTAPADRASRLAELDLRDERLGRQDADAALEAGDALGDEAVDDLGDDNPELDWDEPHMRPAHKTAPERNHGRLTLQRNKEINSGRLYRG